MFQLALLFRLTRNGMLETLNADYIRTAWAKGLSTPGVLFKHALRNVLIPVVTMIGIQFGQLIGFSIVTESIFQWPGAGNLLLTSIYKSDFPVVTCYTIVIAILVVGLNTLVDITYALLNRGSAMTEAAGTEVAVVRQARADTPARRMLRRLLRRPLTCGALVVLTVLMLAAALAPWIAPQNPYDLGALDAGNALLPPVWQEGGQMPFILGTDVQGRDVLSTILYGGRTSFVVGFSVVLLAGGAGAMIGLLAGYFRGWVDAIVMRVGDTLLSFSTTLIAMLMLGLFRQSSVGTRHSGHRGRRLGPVRPHDARHGALGARGGLCRRGPGRRRRGLADHPPARPAERAVAAFRDRGDQLRRGRHA